MAEVKLSEKQKRFCDEYLIDLNGTQAAIRAGYSLRTANEQAAQLLQRPHIKAYIEERKSQLNQQLENKYLINKERVLLEYARIAFADLRCYFNENGSLKEVVDLTEDEAAALASSETEEMKEMGIPIGETKKIKLWDKLRALEGIRKVMGYDAPVKQDHTTKGESLNKGFGDFLQQVNQVK
ncbi:hypothetical protein BWI93_03165 [Siphonobacter sp. BAB-5385]|uniref:terminase small subunit n=1 Tax=Siphonobacter sp. BAB-5385 TaxID=1864822 RepID=UPI000B9DFE12|nr:terminase small subunit [Siphonobacter sp. BAB-5385]OZI09596.1 hypothetical protein BWI93_03165 [Siphonobacter sp. BAB-5385]